MVADIPGIIEGASDGKGLGLRFLRHIERNSILLFMIPCDSSDINNEYRILLKELEKYNPELLDKKRILSVTKCDLLDRELKADIIKDIPQGIDYCLISSLTGEGIENLKDLLWRKLNE